MQINHDYSYITRDFEKLIELGYAEMSIHSLNFDRNLSEEEKEENIKQSYLLTTEQWNKRCENFSYYLFTQLNIIKEYFTQNYDVHQITEEKSTREHYNSDWDLFFYSNKGWNNKDYFDYIKLNFNSNRSTSSIMELSQQITAILSEMNIKNIACRIQYTLKYNDIKIEQDAKKIIEATKESFTTHFGRVGKFKLIHVDSDGKNVYAFFPKGSKKKCYSIDNLTVILESFK
jgi:hypothetical protein